MIRCGDIYDKRWYRGYCDEETYALNPAYQEIIKLHYMLVEHDIPHIIRRCMDGWQVCYPDGGDWIADAIEHKDSYGHDCDLLEIMGLLTPEEEEYDSVLGHLTAENVFNRINTHWAKMKQYEEYKREWCEARGYKLEDVDETTGVNGECYVCFDEWLNNEHAEKKASYNPVEVAYKLLVAYRDANMIPDMGTIEELIGYLGEALE